MKSGSSKGSDGGDMIFRSDVEEGKVVLWSGEIG